MPYLHKLSLICIMTANFMEKCVSLHSRYCVFYSLCICLSIKSLKWHTKSLSESVLWKYAVFASIKYCYQIWDFCSNLVKTPVLGINVDTLEALNANFEGGCFVLIFSQNKRHKHPKLIAWFTFIQNNWKFYTSFVQRHHVTLLSIHLLCRKKHTWMK